MNLLSDIASYLEWADYKGKGKRERARNWRYFANRKAKRRAASRHSKKVAR